jgi:Lrp/AsnC family leucine-responsive transcriptional regulator
VSPIDELDKKILRLLMNDSQTPLASMGEEVGLSTTALHHRIKNLKKRKIIKKFTIALSEDFYESQISCFVKVIKFKKSSIELAQKLKNIPEVESCFSVTGEESLLLKIRARSAKDFQSTLEVINKIDGVERTVSSLIIEEHFNKGLVIL